ncbi:hypothetical protein BUALT_Bualt04G0015700 [Buddleja alternifolia]|uniref:Sulfotransferase n=1 Tax=Buddleja alternifolia TaxID=168488 RepID=A0AAV6XTN5_9LAMI|nr:hypothetical protein BUALT_Bualt04G0015700 [Buddleja alternifolia]
MEKTEDSKGSSVKVEDPKDELQELLQTLEQKSAWNGEQLVKYKEFWFPVRLFRPILSTQKYFKAKNTDIILSTTPKSGTTWLKALTYSIVNRHMYPIDQSPLLTSNPHSVVDTFEFHTYLKQENPDLECVPNPRIFSTHISFNVLPDSIRESECKIIYICRNPLDLFTSFWNFLLENKEDNHAKPISIDEAFDMFCKGYSAFGPFWDHILGYWNAHLNDSEKVMFLKYEDLKEDIAFHIKKIAEFIGFPFSLEEEKQGVVEQISRLCSFENLSNLDVNKTGSSMIFKYSSFFRKGKVGDWTNYLTPAMAERMLNLMESKLKGSGLMFKTYDDKTSC